MFLELNSKGLYQSSGKEKESCCLVFPSSTKHEIRHFYVVVVQRRLRNVQKSEMHVRTYSCFFYRTRSPRRRRCLSSLISDHNCAHKYVSSTSHTSNKEFTLVGETFSFLLLLCQAVAQYNYKKMDFYLLRKNVN